MIPFVPLCNIKALIIPLPDYTQTPGPLRRKEFESSLTSMQVEEFTERERYLVQWINTTYHRDTQQTGQQSGGCKQRGNGQSDTYLHITVSLFIITKHNFSSLHYTSPHLY